ncbi:hypothetical protein FHS88_002281 [Roseomonas alkaliterrae]|uniref:Uncharacterized protein n=1 Tax=Neoroseomonas alkaliterrae TaxID=1452450 RepID=A0A840XNI5_9PROT|nr:hypothetical protein [Neoroseomonas alkaliterrae]
MRASCRAAGRRAMRLDGGPARNHATREIWETWT